MTLVLVLDRTASAQEVLDPGTELLREQERQREIERLRRARPGQAISTPDLLLEPVDETPCFDVKQISLEGTTALDDATKKRILSEFEGRCLGQKSIQAAINAITDAYVSAGFITTRAHIPQQDLRDGRLRLVVIEGFLEAIVYQQIDENGAVTAGPQRKIRTAFPIRPGDIFQLRHVEQGVDQMSRLTSSNVSVQVQPGTQQGGSILLVQETKRDLFRGRVTLDNTGQAATGQQRASFTLDVDDLISLNEQISFSYSGSENANSFTFRYAMPFGRWTLSSSGSYSESVSRLTETTDLFSQTTSLGLELERIVDRDATQKTFLFGRFGRFTNDRAINLAQLQPQIRTHVEFGARHERFLPGRTIQLSGGVIFGRPILDGDGDPPGLPADAVHAEFAKFSLTAFHLKQFESGDQMVNSLNAQVSEAPLFSDQQLTVGGWGTVRGFEGAAETGDAALVFRNEYQRTFQLFDQARQPDSGGLSGYVRSLRPGLTTYGFLDIGASRNIALNRSRILSGAGIGLRGSLGRASIDAALSMPLVQTAGRGLGFLQGMINVSFKLF